MPPRSRKRGRHGPPPSPAPVPPLAEPRPAAESGPPSTEPLVLEPPASGEPREWSPPPHLNPPAESRSEVKNAEVRATLRPYAPGERPRVVIASALLAAGLALANLISWAAGDTVNGTRPAAGGIIVFSVVLLACALGLWQMRAGAVLGWMALMAIIAVLFTLFLIEASNILGAVVAVAIIVVTGYLFFKCVRVLSRLQVPRGPGARR